MTAVRRCARSEEYGPQSPKFFYSARRSYSRFAFPRVAATDAPRTSQPEKLPVPTYLGFDANDYPGDDALPGLRRTFSFAGYWLNAPPGAKTNTWTGKRAELVKNGFGFLVLFNGRLAKELQPPVDASDLGASDAELASRRRSTKDSLPTRSR